MSIEVIELGFGNHGNVNFEQRLSQGIWLPDIPHVHFANSKFCVLVCLSEYRLTEQVLSRAFGLV